LTAKTNVRGFPAAFLGDALIAKIPAAVKDLADGSPKFELSMVRWNRTKANSPEGCPTHLLVHMVCYGLYNLSAIPETHLSRRNWWNKVIEAISNVRRKGIWRRE
jgi:hypothetical protein